VAILRSIEDVGGDAQLSAWVNDASGDPIPIGHGVEYHFVSDTAGHLTALHVDSHGVMTLLHPSRLQTSNVLAPDVELMFPGADDGFPLEAQPPVGREFVLAVATPRPIDAEALGLRMTELLAVVEADEAPAVAQRLLQRFLEAPADRRAVAAFQQRVVGRSEAQQYRSGDIVDYFTTRARSIEIPRLDLQVHFATGSHELDEAARQNLSEVALALRDERMADMRFKVSGHTDNSGTEAYNEDLSERRAKSVVVYLTKQQRIDTGRLDIDYYCELRPLEPNINAAARRLNRRVEFELLR
jgi:outer membrane protein OmpA-like peptidoglycan-associated protein